MTDIARIEWGFDGYVVSDSHATQYIISKHEYFDNPVDTVAACIKAGCNLDLGDRVFVYEYQIEAINQGKIIIAMQIAHDRRFGISAGAIFKFY